MNSRRMWPIGRDFVAALLALALALLTAGVPVAARAAGDGRLGALGPVQVAELFGRGSGEAVKLYRARQYHRARAVALVVLRRERKDPGALSILGWSEYQLGRYPAALAVFKRFVRVAPRSSDALMGLAWSSFKMGRLTDARRYFEEAKPFAVKDQRYIIADGLGWVAYSQGKFDEADRHFASEAAQRARGKVQNDGALGRAWVAMARGDYAAAQTHLETGLKRQPSYFRLHDGLGRVSLLRGRYDQAARHALAGLKQVRFNRELFLLLDAALRSHGDHAQAAGVYRRLIKANPAIPEYYNGLGWAELRRNRLRSAEANFLIALQMRRNYGWAKAGLWRAHGQMHAPVLKAWALYKGGEYRQALAGFNRHLGKAATNPAIHTGRGWALLGLGQAAKAKTAFAKALVVDRNFELARKGLVAAAKGYRTTYLLGWDQFAAKRFAKARVQFLRAKKVAPPDQHWRIAEALAWIDIFEGRHGRAAAVFKGILDANPKAYLSLKGLGYVALERKHFAEALTQLRAAYRIKPAQVATSFTVPGDRLNDAGQFPQAREVLEQGAQQHDPHGGILIQLARVHAGLGDRTRAMILARRAISQAPRGIDRVFDKLKFPAPDLAELKMRLAWALFFAGENKGALRRFDQLVKARSSNPDALRGRGFALFRLGRYGHAIRDLKIAAKSEPAQLKPISEVVSIPGTGQYWPIVYNARSTLAWAYFRTRRYADAAREFTAALKHYPVWIDALTGLGYSLQRQGDRPGATAKFRAALLISPGYPDAWQGLKQLGADR